MSLAVLADHLASKGRNGDTMLVHMTPEEVGGLHALALAHGGSLTINPDTGLVEASFLKRLLPAIAGFALAPLTAGTSLAFLGATPFASALTIGGITGLATGSLRQGIMAGLGAYGGASLQTGLAGMGAGAEQAAAMQGLTKEQIAGRIAESGGVLTEQGVLNEAAAQAAKAQLAAPVSRQLLSGAQAFVQDPGAGLKTLARPLMMAAAPALLEPPKTVTPQPGMGFQYTPRVRPMSWNQYTGELEQLPMFSAINRAGTSSKEEQPPTGMAGGGIVALANGGALKPAEYVAKKALEQEEFGPLGTLSAQQQQELALGEARKGLAAGLSAAQIADVVNAKYNKDFTEQNVRDFMLANQLISAPPTTDGGTGGTGGTGDVGQVTAPITTAPTVAPPSTTPVPVTYGKPFTPDVQTMEQVRSGYVQGGGNIEMPTIGTVAPTERIYTQNRVHKALIDYLASNPNAIYGDVAKLAKELGVPEQQLKAAVNEYRFSSMTGGSKSAYDYLMGRGAYPVNQVLPGNAPLMRPYAEASGLVDFARSTGAGGFFGRKTIPTEPSKSEAKGTTTGSTGTGTVVWENVVTGARTVDIPSRYVNDPEWRVVETKAASGGVMRLASGGTPGVTYGRSFEEEAGINRQFGGMPTAFDDLVARYTPQAAPAPAASFAPTPTPATTFASAPASTVQAARNTALEEILARPRPTLQQQISRLSVPTKEDTKARAAFEQKLASQVKPEEFQQLQTSPYSVLSPTFNTALQANLVGKEELARRGMPSVFGSEFRGTTPEEIQAFNQALMIEQPMGGHITSDNDLNTLLREYMTAAEAGNVGRAKGALSRMSNLGLGVRNVNSMINVLDPEFNSRLYNKFVDPKTNEPSAPLGYIPYSDYFSPGSGGWSLIAQEKARWGMSDEDIAYGMGMSVKEVQDALAAVPAQYKKWPPSGMARGGLADIAAMSAAQGGDVQRYNLGGYSDGGRLLRGPGDGVSDSIPATIGNRQPARLADGEFVVPARIVSEIGNGSTEAGARKLYKMMERVQRARAKTVGKGRSKVAKDTGAEKYLPA